MATPSISINIFIFKINSFENASAVNVGENFLLDWQNSSKKNQGFGQNFGDDSMFSDTRSGVDDRDCFDSNTHTESFRSAFPPIKEVY
jgi:hypothetical protein